MARLPTLNALRAFEAAGRHLSFTRAAEELHVTQAAISHQIKSLEEQLGIRMFRRGPRGLLLTDAGQSYLPEVREAFQRLNAATDRLLEVDARGAITVSVLPSFAARWLVPRLTRFREAHPDIEVRVSADDRLADFDRDDVDVAIRYGRGDYPGLQADRFLTEELFPVCSPELLTRTALERPEDLCSHTLLHDDMRMDWSMWLLAAGVEGVDPRRGPSFNDSSMVLQAAVDGQGVALGRSALALDDLAAGRLVRPFEFSLPAEYAYYILCPERTANRPNIKTFREWLLAQSAPDTEAGPDKAVPAEVDGSGP